MLLLLRMGAMKPTVYAVPTNLHSTASTSTTISLAWTNGVSQPVEIYRNGALVHTTTAGATSYTDTGLADQTVYNYTIRHKNGSAYSALTAVVALATSLPTPGVISNSVVIQSVNLSWSNTTALAPIELWRDAGSGYASLVTLAAGTTSYSNSGLADGVYAYKIRYVLGSTTGSFNTPTSATVAASVNEPTSPSATAHSGSGTQIDLAWTLGTAGAQTEVFRGTTSNPTTLVHTTAASDTTWNDTGLTPNTLYHYRLKGLVGAVVSASYTADFSATTHNPPTGAPTGLAADNTYTNRIALSWTNTDAGATINVYRNGGLLVGGLTAGTTTYNDDTVSSGTSYSYTVRHQKDSITSADSNTATKTPPSPAFASQTITATVGTSVATLTWTILHGPVSPTVDFGAWNDGDGDTYAGATGVSSGATVDLGFTVTVKNPGVNHGVNITVPVKMKNAGGTVVLTDNSFTIGLYKVGV